MPAKSSMVRANRRQRVLDPLGHGEASALGGPTRLARSAAETDGRRESTDEELHLFPSPGGTARVVEALGLFHLFVKSEKSLAVLRSRLAVECGSEAALLGAALVAADERDEISGMEFQVRVSQQVRYV